MFFQTKNFLTRIIKILKIQTPFMAIIIILIIRVMTEKTSYKTAFVVGLVFINHTFALVHANGGRGCQTADYQQVGNKMPKFGFSAAAAFSIRRSLYGAKAWRLRRKGIPIAAQRPCSYGANAKPLRRNRPPSQAREAGTAAANAPARRISFPETPLSKTPFFGKVSLHQQYSAVFYFFI